MLAIFEEYKINVVCQKLLLY